ncbi:hypothetical protein N665_0867s0008 [Sinapis alba]|nr:hypothetical protein N665_0867s0008 [Sinapis alba]
MDSGCSFHSTPGKEVLFDFKEYNGGSVLMPNNTKGSIKGMEKNRIKNSDGSEVILKDVKYMPEVSRNLISYGMLEKSGCNYQGRGFMVRFYKDRKKENIIKEKSKKVTFSENLIQGSTPYGFEIRDSLAQGGDSSLIGKSEEIESKENNEKSGIKLKNNAESDKKKPKHWDNVQEAESLSNELEIKDIGKVSKILGECIFGDRANGDGSLSNIHTSNSFHVLSEAIPGQEFQACCKHYV